MTAIPLVDTTDLSREEWLDYRRQGIGGSDVAAICGLSKYKSPMAVYLEKIGELGAIEDNPKMKAGRMLEPVIAEWFSEETGIEVAIEPSILQHEKYPFMLANIDRRVIGQNAGLEIKNTSEYMRNDWINEQVPDEYKLQCNHYMAVTGFEKWYVCALIGGWDLQWRMIVRDEELIESLITIEERFWNDNVIAKVPPAISHQDTDYLNQTYSESDPDDFIHLEEKDYDTIQALLKAREDVKKAEEREETAKNRIKAIMGSAETAYWQGEKMFTWKATKKGNRVFKVIGGDL